MKKFYLFLPVLIIFGADFFAYSMAQEQAESKISEQSIAKAKDNFRILLPQLELLEKNYAISKESGDKLLDQMGLALANNAKDIIQNRTYKIKDSDGNTLSTWNVINREIRQCFDYSDLAETRETYIIKITIQEVPSFYQVRPKQYEFSAQKVKIGNNVGQGYYKFNKSYPVLWKRAGLFGIGAGLGATALYYGWFPKRTDLQELAEQVEQKVTEQVPEAVSATIKETVTNLPRGFVINSPYE